MHWIRKNPWTGFFFTPDKLKQSSEHSEEVPKELSTSVMLRVTPQVNTLEMIYTAATSEFHDFSEMIFFFYILVMNFKTECVT